MDLFSFLPLRTFIIFIELVFMSFSYTSAISKYSRPTVVGLLGSSGDVFFVYFFFFNASIQEYGFMMVICLVAYFWVCLCWVCGFFPSVSDSSLAFSMSVMSVCCLFYLYV